MDYRSEYALVGDDDAPHDMASHVVGRVATALRNKAERYEGAAVERGTAVLHANHDGHLVTVICGLDDSLQQLGLRLAVSSNRAMMRAIAVFPAVSLAVLFGAWKLIGGTTGAIVGFVVGLVAGVLAAWGVLQSARANAGKKAAPFRTRQVGQRFEEEILHGLERLGITAKHAEALQLAGVDGPAGRASGSETGDEALRVGDERAWSQLMAGAIAGIPT